MRLMINGTPKRMTMSGFGVKGVLSDDNDNEVPVSVMYDYMAAEAPQGNPDRPNPGPGRDTSVEITEITRDDTGEQVNPQSVEFDEAEFIEATAEITNTGRNWNRRMAGL